MFVHGPMFVADGLALYAHLTRILVVPLVALSGMNIDPVYVAGFVPASPFRTNSLASYTPFLLKSIHTAAPSMSPPVDTESGKVEPAAMVGLNVGNKVNPPVVPPSHKVVLLIEPKVTLVIMSGKEQEVTG